MNEREAFYLLHSIPGLSSASLLPLLRDGAQASDFFERGCAARWVNEGKLDPAAARRLEGWAGLAQPDTVFARLERNGFSALLWSDEAYPRWLKETYDPPLFLYVDGYLLPEDTYAVAVVGSRHPSLYGERIAQSFSRRFADAGLTVVSGFAQGIDANAHEGALAAQGGRTLAVLGCGLEVPYPKGHDRLRDRVRARGAMLSEFALDAGPRAAHFPKRNRVIAGMALATVVVEAALRSGSLITARLAIEAGRETYAVPGPVDSLLSEGANRLIQEGAKPLLQPEELLADLTPVLKGCLGLAGHTSEPAGEPLAHAAAGGFLGSLERLLGTGESEG